MTEKFEFTRTELVLLEAACRQRDDLTALEDLIRDEGHTTTGSTGQLVLHPAVTEARLGRAAVAKLLGQLELPDDDAPEAGMPDVPRTARGRAAQRAANRRWDLHRQRTGEDLA